MEQVCIGPLTFSKLICGSSPNDLISLGFGSEQEIDETFELAEKLL